MSRSCARLFLCLLLVGLVSPVRAQEPLVHGIELRELWRRGGDDDEFFFGNLDRVVVDAEGNAYALDTQLSQVCVFSPEGRLEQTFGREGEGPGEWRGGADLFVGLGGKVGVLQAFPGRIILLDLQGKPLGNFPLPDREGGGFQVVLRAHADEDRLILTGNRQDNSGGKQLQHEFLEAYSPDGELIANFHQDTKEFQWGGMAYTEPEFVGFQRRWCAFPDGRVAAPLGFHDYRIHVWKANGELDRIIERPDYETLVRTAEQMETTQKLFDAIISFNPRSTFEVSKTYPAVAQLFARENGDLWVLTGRGIHARPEDTAVVFDVFDREGSLRHQVALLGEVDPEQDALYLWGDRLFVVTDALGAAMNALGAASDESLDDVEPSNLVCFELVDEH